MNAKKKKVLFILGSGAVALVLVVVVFALTFNINSYRLRIEAVASGETGLEVRINGKMGLSFFPFGVSAKDIHVTNKGDEILSLENLKLGAELMPLLKKQLKVTSCELVKPAVTIVKDADGKYNFESTEKKPTKGQPGAVFSLNELKLSEGVLVYLDKKTGEKTEFKDFNLVGSPKVGAVSAVESLAEPIFNLYRMAKRFIQGGKCEVFYNGAVQQPPK